MPSDPVGRRRCEQGNTLLLFPAAVLIVMVLGAIAVDLSIVYLGEREVANLTAAVANDAAAALDEAAFYRRGEVRIDPARARSVLESAVRERADPQLEIVGVPQLRLVSATELEVTIRARVPLVFAAGLPGGGGLREVDATSRAVAEQR